ncbi:type II toxin-antitoxin system mRNA interferase toxin, RelE/StbE family [Candidatus Wolfebacteria bacterium]|nr:type II toxin-antitoxin system mRNA interferase toxin, RelE/StbE family [Candidatus Wolfebacteria bacterium]
MKIVYSPKFIREYKKLPKEIKLLAENKEKVFRKNPFAAALGAHKLRGRLKNFWSFSIDLKHRIIFEFGGSDIVYFHSVGDHSIYE